MSAVSAARADLFRVVMTRAAWRCQCTGQCGQPHTKSEGRCPREHGGYAGKSGGWVRLMAAPADPAASERQAASLPAARLRAWCPPCLAAARQHTRRTADGVQGGLFDL
ncbi:hypothetical protein [Streptomyces sp. MST-110588]|uniref:hypothetical protein n=1 Tax=Streptomyces sp. MST-110588 TaxID=2833628 RepID=UPI001F5CC9B9|nr:hypothetical protein [Streptomyces sp. MST-110588]UNO42439.1 hypothetical protein KGS77_26575 [Streptomyces sp. MST-110588]